MAETIPRLFTSSTNAAAAVKDILDYRFGDNEVFTVDGASGASREDLIAQIIQAGVAKGQSDAYADKVQAGATLVVVHAPFGSARKATVLLDRHQPLPSVVATPAPTPFRYDRSAPLSSIFQWPTVYNDPAPLSRFFRLKALANFSLSRYWNYKELHDEAAPLSSRAKWPTLLQAAAPLSTKLNWRLLSDQAAPLSERMNLSTLSNDPAPLSTRLGIPVLTKRR